MSKINKMSEKFEQKNGRTPSMEEIEEETNLDRKKIIFMNQKLKINLEIHIHIMLPVARMKI